MKEAMNQRLKPEQIKVGRTYKLLARYSGHSITRKVENIEGDQVCITVKGEPKLFPIKDFAALAVGEAEEEHRPIRNVKELNQMEISSKRKMAHVEFKNPRKPTVPKVEKERQKQSLRSYYIGGGDEPA